MDIINSGHLQQSTANLIYEKMLKSSSYSSPEDKSLNLENQDSGSGKENDQALFLN